MDGTIRLPAHAKPRPVAPARRESSRRASFATYPLEHAYDIRTLQELLGHSDASTTTIHTNVLNREWGAVRSPADRFVAPPTETGQLTAASPSITGPDEADRPVSPGPDSTRLSNSGWTAGRNRVTAPESSWCTIRSGDSKL